MTTIPLSAVPLSERGEIRLGFRCNARCGFCYYQELLDNPKDKEPTTEQLMSQLRVLRRIGATEVEFTGGEPTIRHDLVQLTRFARELGFTNISLITNGLRLANPKFAQAVVEAGVNDVLFSIHGHTSELHDLHTSTKGSFGRIMQALHNCQALGARCRATATVTARNHMHTADIIGLFLDLNVACIHLAVFSPVAQANGTDASMLMRYSEAAESIKAAIERHKARLPPLSVKYIPFCFMKGYEQYVMNLYQQSFDPDDWNYYYSNRVRRAGTRLKGVLFDSMVLVGSLFSRSWRIPASYGVPGAKVFGLTRIVELLRKKRPAACRSCAYDLVCDHVWKDYVDRYGAAEISPIPGPKVRHPAWSYVMSRYRKPGARLTAPAIRLEVPPHAQSAQR
jgi:MoaA/NifB/PqqE/SkfB family radical SAM enzyme